MREVFVTGGTGFIGRHAVRRLAEAGHEVRCLIRETSDTEELEELGCELVPGDVTDRGTVLEGVRGCEWAVHLAGLYSHWEPDKTAYRRVNVEGTRNVMEAALAVGVSKVVHVSTHGVWGKPAFEPSDEETPLGPVRFSEYARTKHEGDRIVWEHFERRGLPVVVLYPGPVLGAGDPNATGLYIRDLIEGRAPARALEGSVFTLVHVRDVADAIVRALEKEGNEGERYLIGKHSLSMREINRTVGEISGVPLPGLSLPDPVILAGAWLLTRLADLTGKPPPAGMALDQVRSMKEGHVFDGSKAERELGLVYTPIREAVEEEVASILGRVPSDENGRAGAGRRTQTTARERR